MLTVSPAAQAELMAERARLAATPCEGMTTQTTVTTNEWSASSRDVPCGYVFTPYGDRLRCGPCLIRWQNEREAGRG